MVLGVDVGGTKVAVAAVEGVTATRTREHPTVTVSADALLDGVEHVVREVIREAGEPDAIGVGVPSQIDFAAGTVVTSVNIPLTGVSLRDELDQRFGLPPRAFGPKQRDESLLTLRVVLAQRHGEYSAVAARGGEPRYRVVTLRHVGNVNERCPIA